LKGLLSAVAISFGLFQFQHVAQAQASCPTVDLTNTQLRTQNGAHVNFYKEDRMQGGSELCFAFSSADIVSQAVGSPVSELYMAFMANQDRTRAQDEAQDRVADDGLTIGSSGMSLFTSLETEPVCLAFALPFSRYDSIGSVPDLLSDVTSILRTRSLNGSDGPVKGLLKFLPSLTPAQIQSIARGYNSQNANKIVYLLAQAHCRNTGALVAKRLIPEIGTQANGVGEIQAALVHGKMSRIDVYQNYLTNVDGDGGHSITVVGQKMMGGQCYLQILDSDMDDCDGMDEDHVVNCNDINGTYFTPADQLSKGKALVNSISFQ
jgi:hypothetical protein